MKKQFEWPSVSDESRELRYCCQECAFIPTNCGEMGKSIVQKFS